ncbi:MAG: disulfide bond formation protein B [Rhodocyclaceae bacterium]|nr:disulfide bond formation protein B [Rhodocyclaceae bacterium]MDZ4215136.1 disulfide bond formation protein B [Rhodocyclaceae bacterium]
MNRISATTGWGLLTAACVLTVGASFGLTVWLNLHPCHLCIFQRLLFMVMALFALVATLSSAWPRCAAGMGFVAAALGGMATAASQSWLQWQPAGSVTCAGNQPSMLERFVEWLGQLQPELFLATGFCENKELTILGLSLANLAFISYAALGAFALWLLMRYSIRSKST